jgi:hypothetical protein
MTDFINKLASQSNVWHTTINPSMQQNANAHEIVTTYDNMKLNLKIS